MAYEILSKSERREREDSRSREKFRQYEREHPIRPERASARERLADTVGAVVHNAPGYARRVQGGARWLQTEARSLQRGDAIRGERRRIGGRRYGGRGDTVIVVQRGGRRAAPKRESSLPDLFGSGKGGGFGGTMFSTGSKKKKGGFDLW